MAGYFDMIFDDIHEQDWPDALGLARNDLLFGLSLATLPLLGLISSDVPDPPLVGVELNPGPRGAAMAAKKKKNLNLQRQTKKQQQKPGLPRSGIQPNITFQQVPLSVSTQLQKSVSFSNSSFENRRGLRVTGRQRLVDIVADSSAIGTFQNIAPNGTIFATTCIACSPNSFGGDLYALASCFLQYQFVQLRFIYTPLCSTQFSGAFTLGYNPDGGGSSTPSASSIQTLENAKEFAPYTPVTLDGSKYLDRSHLYFSYQYGGATISDQREVFQGNLVLASTAAGGGTGFVYGAVWVDFTIDLFGMGAASNLKMNDNLFIAEMRRLKSQVVDLKKRYTTYQAGLSDQKLQVAETPESAWDALSGEFGLRSDLKKSGPPKEGEVVEPQLRSSIPSSPSLTFGKRTLP